jgi:hypothetical protein
MVAVRVLSAIVAMLLCSGALAQTQFDPNAPAKRTITVGSEIKRGRDAVFNADMELQSAASVNVSAVYDAIEKVINKNKQQNTDTDGFLLGSQFYAWIKMTILTKLDSPKFVDTAMARRLARIYFNNYRKLQRQMGVSDAALCDIAEVRYDGIKSDIETWSKLK